MSGGKRFQRGAPARPDVQPVGTDPPPLVKSAWLVCVTGADLGATFRVPHDRRVVIGRGKEAEIEIVTGDISRRHALIERRGRDHVLVDLGSRNGTAVNDVRVQEHVLRTGDRIQLGTATTLQFAVHDELADPSMRLAHLERLAVATGGFVQDFENRLAIALAKAERLENDLAATWDADPAWRELAREISTAVNEGLATARRLANLAQPEDAAKRRDRE